MWQRSPPFVALPVWDTVKIWRAAPHFFG